MLFNSYIFLFAFLPITLLGFYAIGSRGQHRVALAWLVGASLFFYGWWNPAYLGLILGSMLFNYAIGVTLSSKPRKRTLTFGIIVNLGLLGYFKYANFFVENLNAFVNANLTLEKVILPLAISFFTFQQIAYLVDAYKGKTHEYRFLHYALFVTFFPQLIAGPIVHHKEMLPQFARSRLYRLRWDHIAVGTAIFTIGLFKKVVLADGIAEFAVPTFQAAENGELLSFSAAWCGALAYSLQLYFDFSGYSDMAIGLARLFGVRLPLNFNSPYKATNIIDFWRRWHMTLSRFLRDYLYIPLGGNRKGEIRRLTNLMVTMLLGGLWHGAGWTFVFWGGLHGAYLVLNHVWKKIFGEARTGLWGRLIGWLLTTFAVVVAWVPFRAESVAGAKGMLRAMFGLNEMRPIQSLLDWFETVFSIGAKTSLAVSDSAIVNTKEGFIWILLLGLIAALAPNTQQFMIRYRPAFETYKGEISKMRFSRLEWRPTKTFGILFGLMFVYAISKFEKISPFLYFQF